jgi:isoleucyl-tRNA synthetase
MATVELEVDALLEEFDATAAARAVMAFVVDDVSNWYVRLNRHRFYEVDGADNRAAFRDTARGSVRNLPSARSICALRE